MKCPNLKNDHWCELTERPSGRIQMCALVSDAICEEWLEIQKEWEEEKCQTLPESK